LAGDLMKISVAIPAYEMAGRGFEMLTYALYSISIQELKDYEIVVSDHSINNDLYTLCSNSYLPIKYIRNVNQRGSSSANINNAIKYCSGDLIKILCQDDYLADGNALGKTVAAFDESTNWLVSSYLHTKDRIKYFNQHDPVWNNQMYRNNTFGTHSCLTIRNNNPILFDENLIFYMDCEYYYRLFQKYGKPKLLLEPTVVQLLHADQVSNTLITESLEQEELNYVLRKHEVSRRIL
jgi:glycosyltransferase involved in cell wall biosynthesis